jgi:hypothetical protein
MRRVTARVMLLALVIVAAMVIPGIARAASVTPTAQDDPIPGQGVRDCESEFPGQNFSETKFDPPSETTIDGITVENLTGTSFDFSTDGTIVMGVIVKGGDMSNLYDYTPDGVTSDTDLETPDEQPQKDISHITFCWEPGEKTSTPPSTPPAVTGFNPLPFVGLGLLLLAGGTFALRRRTI